MTAAAPWHDLRQLLAARPVQECPAEGMALAGILVPILLGGNGPELLFTVRAAHLRSHPGQIAFPGGHVEPGETLQQAALREAHEEVGLQVDEADVLGRLDSHPSPFGSCASPFVATVSWPQQLTVDPGEVDSAFTVPLADLRRITPETRTVHHNGFSRLLHSYRWRDRDIWGLTGNVLNQLLQLLGEVRPRAGAA